MSNEIFFKTAVHGYNKSDVNSFIEKLNNEQVERVNALNDTIKQMQEEIDRLSEELESAKVRCAELEETIAQTEEKNAEIVEKAHKYDTLHATYADIMMEAEYTSKEKVRLAEERADKMLKDADEVRKIAAVENQRIIESTKSEFMSLVENLTSSLDETIEKIGAKGNE